MPAIGPDGQWYVPPYHPAPTPAPTPAQLQSKVTSDPSQVNSDAAALAAAKAALLRVAAEEYARVQQMMALQREVDALQAQVAADKKAQAADQAALNASLKSQIPQQLSTAVKGYGQATSRAPGAPSVGTATTNVETASFNSEVMEYEETHGGNLSAPGSARWKTDAQHMLADPSALTTARDVVASQVVGQLPGNGLSLPQFGAMEWAGEVVTQVEFQDPQSALGSTGKPQTLQQQQADEQHVLELLTNALNSLNARNPPEGVDPALARQALLGNSYVSVTVPQQITHTMQSIASDSNGSPVQAMDFLYNLFGSKGSIDPALATQVISAAGPLIQQCLQGLDARGISTSDAAEIYGDAAGLYYVAQCAQQDGVPGADTLVTHLAQWSYAAVTGTKPPQGGPRSYITTNSTLDSVLSGTLQTVQKKGIPSNLMDYWRAQSKSITGAPDANFSIDTKPWSSFQSTLSSTAALKATAWVPHAMPSSAAGLTTGQVTNTYNGAFNTLAGENLPAGVDPVVLAGIQTEMTGGYWGSADQSALGSAMIVAKQQQLGQAWSSQSANQGQLMPVNFLNAQAAAMVSQLGPQLGIDSSSWSATVKQADQGMQATLPNAPSWKVQQGTDNAYNTLETALASGDKGKIAAAEAGWHEALLKEMQSVYGNKFSLSDLLGTGSNGGADGNWEYFAEVQVMWDHSGDTGMEKAISTGLSSAMIVESSLEAGGTDPTQVVYNLDAQLAPLQAPGASQGTAITQEVLADGRVSGLISSQISAATSGSASNPTQALKTEADTLVPYDTYDPSGVVSSAIIQGSVNSSLNSTIVTNAESQPGCGTTSRPTDVLTAAAPLFQAAQTSPSLTLALFNDFNVMGPTLPSIKPGNRLVNAAGNVQSAADYRALATIYAALPDPSAKSALITAFSNQIDAGGGVASANVGSWVTASFSGKNSAPAALANDLVNGYQYVDSSGKVDTVGKLSNADVISSIQTALSQPTDNSGNSSSSVLAITSPVDMSTAAAADGTTLQVFSSQDKFVAYVAQAYGLSPNQTYSLDTVVFGTTTLRQIVSSLQRQAGVSNVSEQTPMVLQAAPVSVGDGQSAEFRVQQQDGSIVWLGADGSVQSGWGQVDATLTSHVNATTVQIEGGVTEADAYGTPNVLVKTDTVPPPKQPWWEPVLEDGLAITAGIAGTFLSGGNALVGIAAAFATEQLFDAVSGDGKMTVFQYLDDAAHGKAGWEQWDQFATDTGTEVIEAVADGAAPWAAKAVSGLIIPAVDLSTAAVETGTEGTVAAVTESGTEGAAAAVTESGTEGGTATLAESGTEGVAANVTGAGTEAGTTTLTAAATGAGTVTVETAASGVTGSTAETVSAGAGAGAGSSTAAGVAATSGSGGVSGVTAAESEAAASELESGTSSELTSEEGPGEQNSPDQSGKNGSDKAPNRAEEASRTRKFWAATAAGATQQGIQGLASVGSTAFTEGMQHNFKWSDLGHAAAQQGVDLVFSSFTGGFAGGVLPGGVVVQTAAGFVTGTGQTELDDVVFDHHGLTFQDVVSGLIMTVPGTLQHYVDRPGWGDEFQSSRSTMSAQESGTGGTESKPAPGAAGGPESPDGGSQTPGIAGGQHFKDLISHLLWSARNRRPLVIPPSTRVDGSVAPFRDVINGMRMRAFGGRRPVITYPTANESTPEPIAGPRTINTPPEEQATAGILPGLTLLPRQAAGLADFLLRRMVIRGDYDVVGENYRTSATGWRGQMRSYPADSIREVVPVDEATALLEGKDAGGYSLFSREFLEPRIFGPGKRGWIRSRDVSNTIRSTRVGEHADALAALIMGARGSVDPMVRHWANELDGLLNSDGADRYLSTAEREALTKLLGADYQSKFTGIKPAGTYSANAAATLERVFDNIRAPWTDVSWQRITDLVSDWSRSGGVSQREAASDFLNAFSDQAPPQGALLSRAQSNAIGQLVLELMGLPSPSFHASSVLDDIISNTTLTRQGWRALKQFSANSATSSDSTLAEAAAQAADSLGARPPRQGELTPDLLNGVRPLFVADRDSRWVGGSAVDPSIKGTLSLRGQALQNTLSGADNTWEDPDVWRATVAYVRVKAGSDDPQVKEAALAARGQLPRRVPKRDSPISASLQDSLDALFDADRASWSRRTDHGVDDSTTFRMDRNVLAKDLSLSSNPANTILNGVVEETSRYTGLLSRLGVPNHRVYFEFSEKRNEKSGFALPADASDLPPKLQRRYPNLNHRPNLVDQEDGTYTLGADANVKVTVQRELRAKVGSENIPLLGTVLAPLRFALSALPLNIRAEVMVRSIKYLGSIDGKGGYNTLAAGTIVSPRQAAAMEAAYLVGECPYHEAGMEPGEDRALNRTYITPAPWKALADPEFWRQGIGELLPREGTPGTRRVLDRYDVAVEFNISLRWPFESTVHKITGLKLPSLDVFGLRYEYCVKVLKQHFSTRSGVKNKAAEIAMAAVGLGGIALTVYAAQSSAGFPIVRLVGTRATPMVGLNYSVTLNSSSNSSPNIAPSTGTGSGQTKKPAVANPSSSAPPNFDQLPTSLQYAVLPLEGLNVRAQPSLNAPITGVFHEGTFVQSSGAERADSQGNEWEYVRGPGASGWVQVQFLGPDTPEQT